MCEAAPGLRCAGDTAVPCLRTRSEYRKQEPEGCSVDPLNSVAHTFAGYSQTEPSPVVMPFARRRAPASNFGAAFAQDIEPHGRYLSEASPGASYDPEMYETGEVTFRNPLRVEFGGGYGDADNWKRALSARYGGLTGRALSNAVLDEGYDAIVTFDKYGTQEVVDLTDIAESRRWTTAAQLREGLRSRHPDVQLWLDGPSSGGFVTISKIVVPREHRSEGLGTRIMSDITEVADRNGWQLALTPSSDFGGSKTRLERFYRRFGFVPNKGRDRDYGTSESFVRRPL